MTLDLNENHRRALGSALHEVEHALQDFERLLEKASGNNLGATVNSQKAGSVLNKIGLVRERIKKVRERLGVAEKKSIAAVWSIRVGVARLWEMLEVESKYDLLFFLGDIVDYGPEPKPCLEFIGENANVYVRGNHDHALGYDSDCGCRGDFHKMSVTTRAWHRIMLSLLDLAFLQNMPIFTRTLVDNKKYWLSHASPKGELNLYMNAEEVVAASKEIDSEAVLVGHTHIQFLQEVNGKVILNPGSVGLPRNRRNYAAYAVIENGQPELRTTPYDVDKTICGLRESPLPSEIIANLIKVLTKP